MKRMEDFVVIFPCKKKPSNFEIFVYIFLSHLNCDFRLVAF